MLLRLAMMQPITAAGSGADPCVASDDGLSLCFSGPRVSSTSGDGRPLGSSAAGFALLVHHTSQQPTLLAKSNLLINANFTTANATNAELPAEWGPYGLGLFERSTDPAHTRPGGPGFSVIVSTPAIPGTPL